MHKFYFLEICLQESKRHSHGHNINNYRRHCIQRDSGIPIHFLIYIIATQKYHIALLHNIHTTHDIYHHKKIVINYFNILTSKSADSDQRFLLTSVKNVRKDI